jgi:hypothetical protein
MYVRRLDKSNAVRPDHARGFRCKEAVMDDDVRQAIMTRLTVEVWPIAGKALNYKTKSASYAAARRGVIVTVEGQGRRRTVPTAWLRRVLLIDGGEPPKHEARDRE